MSSRAILKEEEKQQIREAIFNAEKKTTGEIVPVVVRASDAYPGAVWKVAVAVAFFFCLLAFWISSERSPIIVLAYQCVGLSIGLFLGNIPFVKRLFLSSATVREEVHQRALQAFFYANMHETRDRTGILIFVSLFERRVEIVADRGINAKVKKEDWQFAVDHLVNEVRQGRLATGVIRAILDCGEYLSRCFPATQENLDELRNEIYIEN